MSEDGLLFNPPPGWPQPPAGWCPPKSWSPDPSWPPPPLGWQLWVPTGEASAPVLTPDVADVEPDEGPSPLTDPVSRLAILEAENAALRHQLEAVSQGEAVVVLDDEQVLQSVGIYRYHHPLENAAAYKERLIELSGRISEVVKAKRAIETSNLFTFDNSLAKGRKMTADLARLMLRAYNAEADNSLRSLRAGNALTSRNRLEASRTSIAKLGRMMEMRISDEFHALRLEEIELTADFLMKKREEREEAREQRARLREERRVQAELAAERERLDKERQHIENALAALLENGESDPDLEKRLAAIDEAIVQNDYRSANIRAGYVYVISNRGAFGSGVVKIGLTRRLEPMDRIRELSGASVPFRFDVHGLFFSEDAVSLEADLHRHFAPSRVNQANYRKEFFFATPSEVQAVLLSRVGNLLEYTEQAASTEFLQSLHYWPEEHQPAR